MVVLGIILFIVFFKEIVTGIMVGATFVFELIAGIFGAIFNIFK